MLLQMALFPSFSWPSNIPSYIVRSWCFFMSMPSKNRTLTHWIEKFQTVLQSLCQLRAPHGVCKSLFLTHPQQHGVLLKVWVDTDLIGENWCLVFFFHVHFPNSQSSWAFFLTFIGKAYFPFSQHLVHILCLFSIQLFLSFLFLVLLHVCYVGCKYFQLPFSMFVSPSKPCGHWNLGSRCFDLYPSVILFPICHMVWGQVCWENAERICGVEATSSGLWSRLTSPPFSVAQNHQLHITP